MNQYEPWKELGLTELDYWKARYIQAREEVAQLEANLEELQGIAESWMHDYDRLKAKYEPSVLSVSAEPAGKNALE